MYTASHCTLLINDYLVSRINLYYNVHIYPQYNCTLYIVYFISTYLQYNRYIVNSISFCFRKTRRKQIRRKKRGRKKREYDTCSCAELMKVEENKEKSLFHYIPFYSSREKDYNPVAIELHIKTG